LKVLGHELKYNPEDVRKSMQSNSSKD